MLSNIYYILEDADRYSHSYLICSYCESPPRDDSEEVIYSEGELNVFKFVRLNCDILYNFSFLKFVMKIFQPSHTFQQPTFLIYFIDVA